MFWDVLERKKKDTINHNFMRLGQCDEKKYCTTKKITSSRAVMEIEIVDSTETIEDTKADVANNRNTSKTSSQVRRAHSASTHV